MDLYVGTIMDVKKWTTKPICGYYNECKKPTIIYDTYMWVLQWMWKTNN